MVFFTGISFRLVFATSIIAFGSLNAQALEVEDSGSESELDVAEDADVATAPTTLDDYLQYAAEHNPGLRAAFERWKAEIQRIPQVRALPDPKLSYTYFLENVETRVGPQEQKFGVSQEFPWFGTLELRGSAAAQKAKAEWQRLENLRFKLFYAIQQVFYQYYFLQRAIETTEENMELLKNFEEVARTRYQTGGRLSDVIKAQVELGKLEDNLATLQERKKPMVVRFNALLNRDKAMPLAVPENLKFAPPTIDEDLLFTRLQALHPELLAFEYEAQRQLTEVELAQKKFYPDFTVGLDYIQTGEADMDIDESGKDPVMAMVGVRIPFWRDKYRAGVREAKASHKAVLLQKENRKNTLQAELQLAIFNYHDATRKITLYGKTLLPKAQQSLAVVQESYINGENDFLSLIDAQRLLLDFELEYERALSNSAIHYAEIEQLTSRKNVNIPYTETTE